MSWTGEQLQRGYDSLSATQRGFVDRHLQGMQFNGQGHGVTPDTGPRPSGVDFSPAQIADVIRGYPAARWGLLAAGVGLAWLIFR